MQLDGQHRGQMWLRLGQVVDGSRPQCSAGESEFPTAAGGVDRAAAGLSAGAAGPASSRLGVLAVWSPCRSSRLPGRQTATPPGSAAAGWAPTGLKSLSSDSEAMGAFGGFVVSLGGTINVPFRRPGPVQPARGPGLK
jgi:hypothetical protein